MIIRFKVKVFLLFLTKSKFIIKVQSLTIVVQTSDFISVNNKKKEEDI